MNNELLQKRLLQFARAFWIALIAAAAGLLLYYVTPLIYPFIVGWFLAYLLNPLVNIMETRLKFPRWLAVTLILIVFLGLLIFTVSIVVANVIIEIGALVNMVQKAINQWMGSVQHFINSDQAKFMAQKFNYFYQNQNYKDTITGQLNSTTQRLTSIGSDLVKYIFNLIIKMLSALPNIATLAVITLLGAFFISKNWFRLSRRFSSYFPERYKKPTRSVYADLQYALFGYVRAQLIILSITTILLTFGLMLLHIKYALSISMMIGLIDLMPYLGTGGVMIPWIIYEIVQKNLYLGLGLTILYGVVVVARQLIEPKVLASNVGLDPLATLIAMFVGLKLFGVVGLIIGPVTLVVLSAFQKANIFKDILHYIIQGPRPRDPSS